MDPLTQGVLGATLSQSASHNSKTAIAGGLGFLGGMAADLDVLIQSSSDPLLALEYHRQFTHSLFFIPIGGLICGLLLYMLLGRRRRISLVQIITFCTLGYATHALLDACTTYGTQLLWPISNTRFAWNIMPIIDPLYTLPILGLVAFAARLKKPMLARVALVWVLAYPALGLVQRDRAEQLGWQLALERGHVPVRLEAKPSFGNLLLWKIVYETDQSFHVDAVRAGQNGSVIEGDSVRKLDLTKDAPWLVPGSQQAKDIERFRWFSNDYLAWDPNDAHRIIDVRYSIVPNEVQALWGITVDPQASPRQHAAYTVTRNAGPQEWQRFWQLLLPR